MVALSVTWQDQAACRGRARIFQEYAYSDYIGEQEIAKRVCRSCVVVSQCLAYAILNGEDYGVWGGTSPAERRNIRVWGMLISDFETQQAAILDGSVVSLGVAPELSWEEELESIFDSVLKDSFQLSIEAIFDDLIA